MADENKNLDVTIRAKDEASSVLSNAFENIKSKAKELNQEARASGDTALERLLKGGGFLGIFTLAGEAMKKVTGEAVKLTEEFEKGKINSADVALEIGKSLPVLGLIVETGENINELFTHQKQIIADMNAETKAANELMELRVKIQRESIKAEQELTEQIQKSREALAVAQVSGPGAKPGEKEDVEGSNKLKNIEEQRLKLQKEFSAKREEERNKEIESIKAASEKRLKVEKDRIEATGNPQEYIDIVIKKAESRETVIENNQILAANERAKKEIDEHARGLNEIAQNNRKAVVVEGANESFKRELEGVKSFFEKSGEELRKVLSPKDDKIAQETSDALAKSKEDQLRISGHALEADLLQLKQAHEKRLAEIRREVQEEVAARPAEAKKIREEESKAIGAADDAYQFDVAKAKADAAQAQADKHAEIQEKLHQGKIEMLEEEGRLGNVAAAREAEQLRIADQYAKKKQEILELSRNASDAEKAALAEESRQLDIEQQKAQMMAALKPQIDAAMEPTRRAGFEDFRKTQGIADAQRERDRSNQISQVQHLISISKGIDELNKKIPTIPASLLSGGGDGPFDFDLA